MKQEVRNDGNVNVVNEESRHVEGYAVRFNEDSNYLGFIERISPTAITIDTINNSDIYARLNHNENSVLARCNKGVGSLNLELRDDGLFYSFDAPQTDAGNELLEHLKRGEITSSSFAFSVDPTDNTTEKWYRDNENNLRRDIYKIERLYDVSPVFSPAYSTTSCSARCEEIKATINEVDAALQTITDEIERM